MVSEVQKVLRVSVLDVVFQEKSAYKKENIICYLYLNEDILEDFEIKDDNHSIAIKFGEKNDKLGVMLQVKETGDIIGCISFMAQTFSSLKKDLMQWVTLFDSPEDDEFDGDLGEDDEETPKILLRFSLETIEKNSKVNMSSVAGKETQKKVGISPRKQNPKDERKSLENAQANSSPIKEGKVEEKVLESKIDNLINVLETQRSLCQNSSRKEFVSTENNKTSSERDYLLQLEMEKNKLLEKSVKQLEEQLAKTEQLYKELEKQSNEKFSEISQATTILNKENYDLKSRIASFEAHIASLDQNKGKISNSVQTQEFIKNLESDLKKAKTERDEERIMNTKLKTEIKQIMNSNSNQFDDLKSKMEQFGQEIKSLHLEKGKLERTCQSLKSKIEVFELENKSLQTDLEISQREVQRLTQEVEEFKTLGSSFRKVVDELNKQKDNEINTLQEKIEDLNKELHGLNQENEILSATNQQLQKNSDILKLLEDENKMEELENKLRQALEETEKLKEESQKNKLQNSDIQAQRDNQIQKDKLEFEINELKLKLKESELVREKYQNAKKKLKLTQEENSGFKQKLDSMQQRLFATAAELVKQTSITVEQNNIIINLNEQMQILDSSLKTAFENITKLQSNIQKEQSQKSQDLSVKKNDIETKLNSFLVQNGLPIKFKKDTSGHYTFGTKKVSINLVNGKFTVVQMDGSSLLLEDFIRLYANQEISKMKSSSSAVNMESENKFLEDDNEEKQMRSKPKPKRTKFESSSNSSKTLRPSRRSEAPSMSHLVNDLSDQDMDKTSEFIIYDITPQGGHDTIVQTKSKRNSQSKIQTNDVNDDLENERKRRSSSKSQDPLRNSLTTKISAKK